jgi:hypothetical protein
MANTYKLIASSTVGSGGAASIDFSSIPSTYTDLALLVSARSVGGSNYGTQLKMVFNNSGGTAYSWRNLEGYDSTAGSNNATSQAYGHGGLFPTANQTASTFGSSNIYIPNYAGSANKSYSAEGIAEKNAATDWIINMVAGLWANTAAINQITLTTLNASNFAQYSTAYLYGIKNS